MRALVVDDSRAMRMVLRSALASLGLEVAEARHGGEALAYLQEHADTTVALVDWNMPEMNGLEFVEAVRADARLNDVRLVMVTSETDISHVARALEAGACEYVMKPFTPDTIQAKLALHGLAPDHGLR